MLFVLFFGTKYSDVTHMQQSPYLNASSRLPVPKQYADMIKSAAIAKKQEQLRQLNESSMTLAEAEEAGMKTTPAQKQTAFNYNLAKVDHEKLEALKSHIRLLEKENESLKVSLKEIRGLCGLVTEFM
jgi:hypothetical protein